MAIKFKVLAEPKDLHTGDPTVCANKACMAILNSISTVREEKDKSKKVRKATPWIKLSGGYILWPQGSLAVIEVTFVP